MSHRIAVMYLGQIVELGPQKDVCRRPIHPYSVALLSAVPSLAAHTTRVRLLGEPPRPSSPRQAAGFTRDVRSPKNDAYTRFRNSASSKPVVSQLVTSPSA